MTPSLSTTLDQFPPACATRLRALHEMGVSEPTILKGIEILRAVGTWTYDDWSFFTDCDEDPMPLRMEQTGGLWLCVEVIAVGA